MKNRTSKIVFAFLILFGINSYAQKKSFDVKRNEVYIDSMMTNALEKGFFPGAEVIVGSKDAVFISKNYGFQDYSKKQPVKNDDVYDLASMSKVLGATIVTMRLVGEDKMKLTNQVGDVVPFFKNTPIADLTLFELLTHTSGLKASITFYQDMLSTPDGSPLLSDKKSAEYPELFDTMYVNKNIVYDANYLSFTPKENWIQVYKNMWMNPDFYKKVYEQIANAKVNQRGKYVYSDLNLLLVKEMIEAKTGKKLDQLANEIYKELGISKIGYNPLKWTSIDNVMPTELDNFFRKDTIRGYVHDEAAAIFGGVSGNAGLFANAQSISVICQMLLNEGKFQGKQILKAKVVKEFTQSPLTKGGIYRGLGFDKRKPDEFFKADDFGHTGFTGTFFFMNPDNNRFLIVLTNRVNPTRTNRLMYKDDFMAKIWKQINK
ncbi:CubicO group peptidase (beta-lactamase class C family) [Flavobacterium nitrogenifigens]|uniref:CubicO group peptidase (Beta-lactamase class C family) n=2 Tax=Flavobacterium TaxID=237 RepID=A0A7W7NA64_9FLAO|nr:MULTISPECIES: serine hydrolase [Flavobacterium]MBB4804214.1 CubicO group peptidase (beta-lactamase class C family) [Flavobacterium nitrogenifigens]MBB6389173.1 CubicO group peptidase (beta-lactamase class C family) [Flavobacterium notoginsengisoli]